MRLTFTAKAVIFAIVATIPFVWATEGACQVPATHDHHTLMERKLDSAQQLLAGIARNDMSQAAKQSQMLRLLSQEASWNVLQTPEYIRLSDSFRQTTQQLEKAANDNNMDAVGLAYVKLTISCIDCHRYTAQAKK